MARTLRQLQQWRKFVDVFIEVRDARGPLLTHNPEIDKIFADRGRIIVLNKADLADPDITASWCSHLEKSVGPAFGVDHSGKRDGPLLSVLGIKKKDPATGPVQRVGILGVSNVGKSTIVNRLAGRKAARVEARPGVTRHLSWIKTPYSFEILDSPGLVPPRIPDGMEWFLTAALGIVRYESHEIDEIAYALGEKCGIDWLARGYGFADYPSDINDFFPALALHLSMKLKGNKPDIPRLATRIITDFSRGKLPSISLEVPKCSD